MTDYIKMILLWFATLCLAVSSIAANILNYDGADFQKNVLDSKSAILVNFYSGESADDQRVLTILEQLQEKIVAYGIRIGRCNCADKVNKKLCTGFRILPSFQLFVEEPKVNPYTRKKFRNGIMFEANALDVRSLEKFVAKNYPTKVHKADSLAQFDEAVNSVSGHSLVLFSEKSTITMLLKSIAFSFANLNVVQVSGMSLEDINQKFGNGKNLERLPSLALLSSDKYSNSLTEIYSGDLKARESIVEWIKSVTKLSDEETPPSDEDSNSENSNNSAYKDAASGETMKTYSSESFTTESLSDSRIWIVTVVAAGVKDTLGDDWKKLTGWCEGVIKPTMLVCNNSSPDDGFGSKFCRRELPYVAVFPYSTSSRKKIHATPEKGSHIYEMNSLESVKKAATESLPDSSVYFLSEAGVQDYLQAGQQRSVLSLIVLSDKTSAPPMLRNLGVALEKYVQVALMSNPSREFLGNIGNPKLPTAIVMFEADGNAGQQVGFQVVIYESALLGPMKFSSLQHLVLQSFARSSFAEKMPGSGAQETSSASSISGEVQKELLWAKDENEWNQHCGTSFRGICAVGLLKSNNEVSVDAMKGIMADLGSSGAAFRFIAVDAECQYGFANRFDTQYENFPALVAYSASKSRYAVFKGTFKADNMKEFLSSILSGKVSTISIPQRPSFASECDGQVSAAIIEESSESKADADDFMEEIRREEAERKAALKKEMQEEEARRKKEEAELAAKPKTIKRKVKKSKKKKTAEAKSEL